MPSLAIPSLRPGWLCFVVFAILEADPLIARGEASDETDVTPRVVFVPEPDAWELAKHPSLPVLYVGCQCRPDSKNLVTFRLNADGTIASSSRNVCDNYFSVDGKNPNFAYRLYRPTVAADERILYLGIIPCSLGMPSRYFANTNNNELAAVALDGQGQPGKLLTAFRTEQSGVNFLMNLRYLPSLRRLFVAYYSAFGWCELDPEHVSSRPRVFFLPTLGGFWYWACAPEWQRFYASQDSRGFASFQLSPDGTEYRIIQTFTSSATKVRGNFHVSRTFHKVYVGSMTRNGELLVYSLTADGRITGLPRSFRLGKMFRMQIDSVGKLLYAVTRDGVLRAFTLDANGYPAGDPAVSRFSCGEVRDFIVDESTGKLYVACAEPPVPQTKHESKP